MHEIVLNLIYLFRFNTPFVFSTHNFFMHEGMLVFGSDILI